MRTLTYWYARCLDDADCYSIRAATLKECRSRIANSASNFKPPVKVCVEYSSAFDLLQRATSEGGLYERPVVNGSK